MKIISRSQWGAKPWNGTPHSTPLSSRRYFLVHYHGGPPPQSTGTWVPKNVEAIHLANGWSGTGYSWMVDQAGNIYEGRGWNLVGAHCPGRNTDGFGVYVAIGGDQTPTDAALRSVRALYDEANRKTGRTLIKSWHGANYATACPGPKLIAWVKAGMPASGVPTITGGSGASSTSSATTYYQPKNVSMTVKQIQQAVGVKADGYYGDATKREVRALQKKLGVTADSLWGPATEKAYKAQGKPKPTTKPKPSSSSKAPKFPLPKGHYFGPKSGPASSVSGYYSHRADLKKWQAQMRKRGWSITADGLYGSATAKVAKQFQAEKRLGQDGLVGISTWRAAWEEPVT